MSLANNCQHNHVLDPLDSTDASGYVQFSHWLFRIDSGSIETPTVQGSNTCVQVVCVISVLFPGLNVCTFNGGYPKKVEITPSLDSLPPTWTTCKKKKWPLFAKDEPFSKMAPLRHHFGSTFFLSDLNFLGGYLALKETSV